MLVESIMEYGNQDDKEKCMNIIAKIAVKENIIKNKHV